MTDDGDWRIKVLESEMKVVVSDLRQVSTDHAVLKARVMYGYMTWPQTVGLIAAVAVLQLILIYAFIRAALG